MTDRILDLSECPARLRVRNNQLVIAREGTDDVSLPLADLAVLVVSHPQVTYTQAVLAGLAAAGGVFVACDAACMPVAMLLPLTGHHVQTERFAAQARAPRPVCKRLWRQLIRAKVRAQAALLEELHGDDHGLKPLSTRVRSGDPSNIEGQASRRYWPALFADPNFRRRRENPDQNALLNYGYAVLRAIVARAICAAGLHPSLGLHHHNRYNGYCLADDLMEPFRPLVDRIVYAFVKEHGVPAELTPTVKRELLTPLTGRVMLDGEQRTLFDVLGTVAASLAEVFMGNARRLTLPELSAGPRQPKEAA